MQGEQFLLLPGPTPIPDRIMRAMNRPMIDHRGSEFKNILFEVTEEVKKIYRTRHHLLIYSSSGSGALEAAVVNFISPGDKVLVISIGVFGERLAKIAAEFGAQVEKASFPMGKAADPAVIMEILNRDKNREIKAILVTHNETSTGVVNDIKAIKEAMGEHPALLIVDSVSGLAAHDFRMDEWGVDVAASGSQKAFMVPPGLSLLAFNEKALSIYRQSSNCKFYWDVSTGLNFLEKGQTPFTPAIATFFGLQEGLRMIAEEGLDHTIERHRRYRDMVRSALQAMGLGLLADDDCASCAVTSVLAPPETGANAIRRYMLEEFNIVLAGGQLELNDVIFRLGHLGYVRDLDLLSVLAALEITLVKLGFPVEFGAGVRKAQQFILNSHTGQ